MNLRYPGQVDDANGLFYNWHRFYQPQTGRYTQADPIGLEGGWNRFAYVGGNPLGLVDPLGLFTEVIIWDGVGRGASSFGHVSTNINGRNYSFGTNGWDRTYESNAEYIQRNVGFRSGVGYIINTSKDQELLLAACMARSQSSYNIFNNNCGTAIQACMGQFGINIGNSIFPRNVASSLAQSSSLKGITVYNGPPKRPVYAPFSYGP